MRRLFTARSCLDVLFLILLVFSLVLMTLDRRTHYLDKTHAAIAALRAPLYRWIDWPAWAWDQLRTGIVDRHRLSEENARLRLQQLLLRARVNALSEAVHTSAEMQQLMHRVASGVPQRSLVAHLLSVHLSPFAQRRFVDQGRTSGVYSGQPVIDAGGVLGQVVAVGRNMSQILLLSDARSAVPVHVQRNGVQGVVVGLGAPGRLQLLHISDTLDVRVGDQLLTSGMGARYPMGYPVGVVTRMQHRAGARFVTVAVRPNAHLARSTHVLLLWPQYHESIKPKSLVVDHS